MEYSILGSLELHDNGASRALTSRRALTLLAVLLTRPGQVVTTGQLVQEIWLEEPPRRAQAALHVHVSHVRKFVTREHSHSQVATRAPGYLIEMNGDSIDLDVFDGHVQAGREHLSGHRLEEAGAHFDAALALWRGPVLGDLRPDGPILKGFTASVEESHLECQDLRTSTLLALGRHEQLIGPLHRAVAEHPLRESSYSQLMIALHRAGRSEEALGAYRTARRRLNDELGVDPGNRLRQLHQAILRDDLPAGPTLLTPGS